MNFTNGYVDNPDRQCRGKHGYGSKSKAKKMGRRAGLRTVTKSGASPHNRETTRTEEP